MGTERRAEERWTYFKVAELSAEGDSGSHFPIMLRDSSSGGLGGVHVGQEAVNVEDRFRLEAEGSIRNVRVVWKKKIAEYVSLLGFEIMAA